jgi:hypothetical protein
MVLGMLSCRKDKVIPSPSGDCQDFEINQNFLGVTIYSEDGEQFKTPCYNPTNGNEIIFYFKDQASEEFALYKYNISNHQKIKISDAKIYGQPKWSKKGWIVFTRTSGYVDHVFIVKDNGDSLRQITINTANLFPSWSSDGITLYWQHNPVLATPPYYLFRQGIYESLPDTVLYDYAGFNDISNNNVLVSVFNQNQKWQFSITPTDNINFAPQTELVNSSIEGLSWHPNNFEFFYSEYVDGGLKKFNINTKQIQTIFCHCDSKYYRSPSCSSDGKKLVVERVDQKKEYDNNRNFTGRILKKSKIVLIDLQTLSETIILE